MANERRMLGRRVAQTLMEATKSDEANMLIGRAAMKLRAQQEALRSYRVGAVYGYVEPGPAGDSTASLLEAARRLIKHCREHHGQADRMLPRCFEVMGRVLSAEALQSWAGHSRNVILSAAEAQMRLRNGVAFATAANDAISVAVALPPAAAIQRRAWLLAAEQLQSKAIDEVCMARFCLQQMRGQIRLLFRDAGIMAHLA